MPVVVTVSGKKLEDLPLSEELMRNVGLLAMRLIRTRTEQRRDVNGVAFRPLSVAYAKAKAAAGLRPIPDLTVSGGMLNDMVVMDVTDRSVALGFISSGGPALTGLAKTGLKKVLPTANTFIQRSRSVGAADKAFYHTEEGAGRSRVIREFFALSEGDQDEIETAIDTYFDRVMEP